MPKSKDDGDQETGLALVGEVKTAIARANDPQFLALVKQEMGDLDGFKLTHYSPQAGGARGWRDKAGESYPDFEGVILGVKPVNCWWREENPSGLPPDCSALEPPQAICAHAEAYTEYLAMLAFVTTSTPLPEQDGDALDCMTCPLNRFGTGRKGLGKACQNKLHVLFMSSADSFPCMLRLPPTSKVAYQAWVRQHVLAAGVRTSDLAVRMSTMKASSRDGISYSVVDVQILGQLPPEVVAAGRRLAEQWMPALTMQPLETWEYPEEENGHVS